MQPQLFTPAPERAALREQLISSGLISLANAPGLRNRSHSPCKQAGWLLAANTCAPLPSGVLRRDGMCPGVFGVWFPWGAGASLCPSCMAFASVASDLFWTNFPDRFGKVPFYQCGSMTLWRIKSLFVQRPSVCVPGCEDDGLKLHLVSLSPWAEPGVVVPAAAGLDTKVKIPRTAVMWVLVSRNPKPRPRFPLTEGEGWRKSSFISPWLQLDPTYSGLVFLQWLYGMIAPLNPVHSLLFHSPPEVFFHSCQTGRTFWYKTPHKPNWAKLYP